MGRLRTLSGPACAALLLLAGLTGCGADTHSPLQPSSSPFTASSVSIIQQGNADVTIDTSSVTFMLDDTRSLVTHLSLSSHAPAPITVVIRGSIYDPNHQLVGDVTGGQINVAPGSIVTVQLNGPTPLGTIASATFEATAQASPA